MFPILLVPLALVLGIATHQGGTPARGAAADTTVTVDANAPVTIAFENQAWELATVYAVPQSGMAMRLGQVTPGSTARFRVPQSIVGGGMVDFVAVPFARNYVVRSGPVSVIGGDALKLSLPSTGGFISVLPAR